MAGDGQQPGHLHVLAQGFMQLQEAHAVVEQILGQVKKQILREPAAALAAMQARVM